LFATSVREEMAGTNPAILLSFGDAGGYRYWILEVPASGYGACASNPLPGKTGSLVTLPLGVKTVVLPSV
jgi:hypothetical protein